MRFLMLTLAATFVLGATPLLADVVILKNGGRVEGVVEDLGDVLRVRLRTGSVTIPKVQVAGVTRKPTPRQLLEQKRGEIDPKSPGDLVKLGNWCREQGLEREAVGEFRAALAIDPDHRGARRALGHIFYEGEWRTEREIMERKGFIPYRGEWVTPEEAAARKALEAREKKTRDVEKALNRHFRRLASRSARTRERAYRDIVTLARELENPELEDFAAKARGYYDRAWEIVNSQTAILEIRAQMSRLKRPIQTLSTTLGTGTPVKIQLPELSIASVGTTVVVPLGGK